MTAIKFENVHYQLGTKSILKNINGSIPSGKITALVGPSGAGKSTLLKLCNGLISPTSGTIFVHDKPITTYNPVFLRKKVGIALQNAPMIQGTVYDNLTIPLNLEGKTLSKKDGIRYLQTVGLHEHFLNENINDLSGGERQRVSIARTLINKSDILLLDEITSALDKAAATEIEQLILNINQAYNVTMIWITHDIEQAKRVADNVWVMIEGNLAETGGVEIFNHATNKD